MKQSILWFCAAIGAVVLPSTSSVQAQGTSEQRASCMGDAFKFCYADIPNVKAIELCLRRNIRGLQPMCQKQFGRSGKSRKAKVRQRQVR
jgi:hypothetical protein